MQKSHTIARDYQLVYILYEAFDEECPMDGSITKTRKRYKPLEGTMQAVQ
jgi:hypothetical protein